LKRREEGKGNLKIGITVVPLPHNDDREGVKKENVQGGLEEHAVTLKVVGRRGTDLGPTCLS